jgi:hypothetical protein
MPLQAEKDALRYLLWEMADHSLMLMAMSLFGLVSA